MPHAFIGIGSNLGNRRANLDEACARLVLLPGIQVEKISPVYETDPVGGPAQAKYLNAVWEIETGLSPSELLSELLSIETQMGRQRTVLNAPRTIDLDILLYDQKMILEPGLQIPHPRLHERWFALKPLADIAPDFMHPVLKRTIQNLLEAYVASHQKS